MNRDKKPNIICMGILDTKGDEIKFLAEEVNRFGGNPRIMELSLGAEVGWADFSLSDILSETNTKKEDVFKTSRSEAIALVGEAGAKKIVKLYEKGEVNGVIAWAGSIGTTVATMVMRALPIGFPKYMLSTLAAGDVSGWLGNKDICIVNPIAEKGINRVTQKIIANAASAIVAMAKVSEITEKEYRPLAALTAYGTTTPTVMKCEKYLKDKGWDTIVIHQVGTGATMEDLIRSGLITAVYDITTGELSNNMLGSIYAISKDWNGKRLTAASDMGIPQIVCPGGLAQCAWGPVKTVPQKILDEFKNGLRVSYKNSGTPYVHNEAVTVITPTLEETKSLALEIITKLNKTKGPTALILPMRGWSAYDQPKELASVERGWAKGKGDSPVWWPDTKNPKWSKRATAMWSVFLKEIDKSNPNLDLLKCDMNLLDEEFVELLKKCMDDMLKGKWKKGLYRDLVSVIE